MGRVVRREEAPRSDAADATRSLAVLEAVRAAAATGQTVRLDAAYE